MTAFRTARPGAMLGLAVLLAAAALLAGVAAPQRDLPPIVFVSRLPEAPGVIPGLGPHARARAPGGRLLVREPHGAIRPLVPARAFHDVSDPAVSPGGTHVAFAGIVHPDSSWRIFTVGGDGTGLAAATSPPAGADDLDPCWISDDLVAFASTREKHRAQYADVPVTNLWLARIPNGAPAQITWERNGAEEPVFDPSTGRIVYARWWFNSFQASALEPSGVTTDPTRALPRDSVNLWHAVEIAPDGTLRLAFGAIPSRLGAMAYQPVRLADGTWASVYAGNLGLSPAANGTGIRRFARRYQRGALLAGAAVAERAGDAYHDARGLAPSSACAPAALPDGRIVFAFDPGARGDFGIWVMRRDGSDLEPLMDLSGTLELDPAPLVARRGPQRSADGWRALLAPGGRSPAETTFVYDCRSVFASGSGAGATAGAPPRAAGLAIRFFAVRIRADGRDSVVLLRDAPVEPSGRVRAAGLPAEEPLFEQLVDRNGRPVVSALGPAHVAGFNYGRASTTAACAGCHVGHSTLPAR